MNRLLRLASSDGRRVLRALILIGEVEARLRLSGFARLQAVLSHEPKGVKPEEQSPARIQEARQMARAIRRASRYVPRARCLHRSLALLIWLRRRGVRADLRLGVRLGPASTEGHAWVEWGGVLLNDDRIVCDTFPLLDRPAPAGAGQEVPAPAARQGNAPAGRLTEPDYS